MNKPSAKEILERRFWKESKETKPKATTEYIPLEEREDQSWRDKVEILPSGK